MAIALSTAVTDPFWERFFTSAGFGGCMAFLAALVAGTIALAQYRHSRRQNRDSRWWETLTWVYDRTIVDEKQKPLPHTVALSMLQALLDQTREKSSDPLQARAIASVINLFVEPAEGSPAAQEGGDSGKPSRPEEGHKSSQAEGSSETPRNKAETESQAAENSGQIVVTDPVAQDLLHSIQRGLELNRPRSSLNSPYQDFEASVQQALLRIARKLDVSMLVAYTGGPGWPDFVASVHDVSFKIEVKYTSQGRLMFHHLLSAAELLTRRTGPQAKGSLVVTNSMVTDGSRQRLTEVFGNATPTIVTWRDDRDDHALETAVTELLAKR